jgi:hypothetical protein
MTTHYYSINLPDGIVILYHTIVTIEQYDMMTACNNGSARFYKLVNPRPEFVGYSYAYCIDSGYCLLLKEFPSNELRPLLGSTRIHYDKMRCTIDPVESDKYYRENRLEPMNSLWRENRLEPMNSLWRENRLEPMNSLWRENHISEQRENYILNGLAALQEAIQALDHTERILAAPSSSSPVVVLSQPSSQNQNQNKKVQTQARISKLMIADAVASNATCPITTNPLTLTNAVCVAPCYHIFEREAICIWLETKDTCPECRQTCSL